MQPSLREGGIVRTWVWERRRSFWGNNGFCSFQDPLSGLGSCRWWAYSCFKGMVCDWPWLGPSQWPPPTDTCHSWALKSLCQKVADAWDCGTSNHTKHSGGKGLLGLEASPPATDQRDDGPTVKLELCYMVVKPTEALELGCLAALPHPIWVPGQDIKLACLSFPIYKTGRVIIATVLHRIVVRIKWIITHKAPKTW